MKREGRRACDDREKRTEKNKSEWRWRRQWKEETSLFPSLFADDASFISHLIHVSSVWFQVIIFCSFPSSVSVSVCVFSFVPEPSPLLLQSFVSFVTYIIHSNILFLPQLFSPSHEIINCYFSPFFFFASFDSFDCLPSKWSTLFDPRGFCASDSILVKDEKRVRKEKKKEFEKREWCKA